jgi:hypothetical protein
MLWTTGLLVLDARLRGLAESPGAVIDEIAFSPGG